MSKKIDYFQRVVSRVKTSIGSLFLALASRDIDGKVNGTFGKTCSVVYVRVSYMSNVFLQKRSATRVERLIAYKQAIAQLGS